MLFFKTLREMGPILAVLLLSCSIEAQKQNRVCSRRGQRLDIKDGHLETIRISKAKVRHLLLDMSILVYSGWYGLADVFW